MRVLIFVDIQNDFIPGGALAVAQGDQVVAVANTLAPKFDLVVSTQDWHPADHGSFAANHPGKKPFEVIDLHGLSQVLWPVHCVQGSKGAGFVAGLDMARVAKVFPKGTDKNVDSYSGFFDNGHRNSTGMGDWLREKGAKELYLVGLATDYCVKFTALDARKLGFRTFLVEDGCRGVELKAGDSKAAISEMRKAGIKVVAASTLA